MKQAKTTTEIWCRHITIVCATGRHDPFSTSFCSVLRNHYIKAFAMHGALQAPFCWTNTCQNLTVTGTYGRVTKHQIFHFCHNTDSYLECMTSINNAIHTISAEKCLFQHQCFEDLVWIPHTQFASHNSLDGNIQI